MQISVIKIDVYTESVYAIEINANSLKDLYKAVGCQTIDFVARQQNGDALCVDDEALLEEAKAPCFRFMGYPSIICGNALVIGSDSEGGSTTPRTTLEEVRQRVRFLGFRDVQPAIVVISF
ncbi:DUF3846 domain-containing protein [Larkinella sp. GY13]|uniref:DUF3846 domain-containing protein n=1 Tax=Larkinella sp. GY13 TaxID=3453720 RepID=UPI003EEB6BC1